MGPPDESIRIYGFWIVCETKVKDTLKSGKNPCRKPERGKTASPGLIIAIIKGTGSKMVLDKQERTFYNIYRTK
jgi:hypothetical protein